MLRSQGRRNRNEAKEESADSKPDCSGDFAGGGRRSGCPFDPADYDRDGIDDYRDLMLGARADQENAPKYRDGYYDGGYPPEGEGVCTDVIWHAFKAAGYSLKDMVDKDIAARTEAYPEVETPDPNIDFRRVKNLRVFFDTYGIPLSLDPAQIDQWQPGDLVLFGSGRQHIGIVSDRRNAEGWTYVIHNTGQKNREEDYLKQGKMEITGHYRFDASRIPPEVLVPWNGD